LIGDLVNSELHIGEIQGTGHEVDQADTDEVKGRANRPHDQVLENSRQCAPVPTARNEHVTRE